MRRPASTRATAPSWGRTLVVAAFLALLTSAAEVAVVMGAVWVGLQVRLSAHYVWMIPAANLALFLLVATTLSLLARLSPRLGARALIAGVLVGLAALTLLLLVERVHDVAMLLLATGLGVQAARGVDRRLPRLARRWAASGAAVLAGATLFLGVSMARTLARSDSRALAALPSAPAGRPNVLLLILDTVRQTSTSLHPGGDQTPRLAELAGTGVVFTRAIATAPWTLPSHGSMFTGRWAHELSAGWATPLDRTHPTLAEALAARGYEPVAFVGNTLFASRATGLARGFVRYQDYPLTLGQVVVSTSWGRALAGWSFLWKVLGHHDVLNRRGAEAVSDDFLDWLDRRDPVRPFFAFVNFFDAHEPHFPPAHSGSLLSRGPKWTGFVHTAGLFAGTNAWLEAKWELAPEQRALYTAGYDEAIRRADLQLGRVIDGLRERGALANTIVVVAGDHGEQLGERDLFQHNNSLYLPALRVPLVIVNPARPSPQVVDRLASLRDVPATILALVGVADPRFPGRDLLAESQGEGAAGEQPVISFLEQERAEREDYPTARGRRMFALTTERWHYIRNGDGSQELYEWASDPRETSNLMGSPADSAAVRLGAALDGLLRPR